MSRVITDNPGGWSRSLPGHTVEYEASFAQPFYYGASLVINAGVSQTYTLTITDTEHIYFIDVVNVTPQAFKELSVLVYVNDLNYLAAAGQGYIFLNLRQNPSIQLISGDHLDITVVNLDGSQRTFLVKVNGTKIVRPANFGHAPGAYWTAHIHDILLGWHVHFTDGSSNSPTSWDWDFGDGTPHSSEQNPQHTYDILGTFYPRLKVTNQYGHDFYAESTPIVVS
jgi:PKD repeat protein